MKKISALMAVICMSMLLFCGCTINFGDDKLDIGTSGKLSQEEDLTGATDGINELVVNNNVGDVHIQQGDDKIIRIKVYEKITGHTEEIRKKILGNINLSIANTGSRAVLEMKTKDSGEEFWRWLKEKYGTSNMSIDLRIDVPMPIKTVQVSTGVGDIETEKLNGKISTTTGVGDIRITTINGSINASTGVGKLNVVDAILNGTVILKTGTGDISLDADLKGIERLSAKTGVGDVRLTIPGSTKASLDAATGVGEIDGNLVTAVRKGVGGSIRQDLSGGGPDITLNSGTGDIRVNSK